MKKLILPLVIVSAMISGNVNAQSSRAFSVTSEAKGSVNWLNVQEINFFNEHIVVPEFQNLSAKIDLLDTRLINVENKLNRLEAESMNNSGAIAELQAAVARINFKLDRIDSSIEAIKRANNEDIFAMSADAKNLHLRLREVEKRLAVA